MEHITRRDRGKHRFIGGGLRIVGKGPRGIKARAGGREHGLRGGYVRLQLHNSGIRQGVGRVRTSSEHHKKRNFCRLHRW